MTRRIVGAILNALAGATAGAAALAAVYGARPALRIDFQETPPPQFSGIYTIERDPASRLTFAWTGEFFTIRLAGLDRRVAWRATIRMRGARPEGVPNPSVRFVVDGLETASAQSASDFENVHLDIPARPERRGAVVTGLVAPVWIPGSDPRTLGVMLDVVELVPDGLAVPPRRAMAATALASAAPAAAFALLGFSAPHAAAAGLLTGAGLGAVAGRGFGPYTSFAELLARFAAWISGVAVFLVLTIQMARRRALSVSALLTCTITVACVLLKLAVLLHPDMPVGDAMFHAHRYQYVLAGNRFFTSVAPGGYSFPYAPGLYVVAAPFAELVTRGDGDMRLLRTIVICADAIAAVLVYAALVRSGVPPRAGLAAVAVYHAVPLAYRVATVGNLTNAFGQAVGTMALALTIAPLSKREGIASASLLGGVLTLALLSHTSTLAIVSIACLLIAALYVWAARPELRRAGTLTALALVVALLLAVTLYYAHFAETYRAEWSRLSREIPSGTGGAGSRGIVARLGDVPRLLYLYFGIPALALAVWGATLMVRMRDRLTLAALGWALSCSAFLVLGILTPIDMRHYLAAIPVIAIAAGIAVDTGLRSGGVGRAAATALLSWASLIGVHTWWTTMQ